MWKIKIIYLNTLITIKYKHLKPEIYFAFLRKNYSNKTDYGIKMLLSVRSYSGLELRTQERRYLQTRLIQPYAILGTRRCIKLSTCICFSIGCCYRRALTCPWSWTMSIANASINTWPDLNTLRHFCKFHGLRQIAFSF